MKIILIPQNITFLAIFALSFITCENVCFGTEQESVATLDKRVSELEEIWKAGKTTEYYLKARDIVRDMKADPTINKLNKVAVDLFRSLISKEVEIGKLNIEALRDLWMGDLPVINDLAWFLVSNDKASIEERRTNALLLSMCLGKIRKELILNFKPKQINLKPHPPRGVGPSWSGMPSAAITNPVLRAQYEAAIRENQENAIINKRQRELKSIEGGALKTRIIGYIIETFRGDDTSSALLAECINSAKLSDQEKEEVLKKVGVK